MTFPKLYAFFTGAARSWYAEEAFDALAYHDIVEVNMDAQGWRWLKGDRGQAIDPVTALRWRAPAIDVVAYVPFFFWWMQDVSDSAHPHREQVRQAIEKNNWWLRDSRGNIIQLKDGEGLLDFSNIELQGFFFKKMIEIIEGGDDESYFDGIRFDVLGSSIRQYGTTSKPTIEQAEAVVAGAVNVIEALTNAQVWIIGNESWQPSARNVDGDPPYDNIGVMLENPHIAKWYGHATTYSMLPPSEESLEFHMTNLMRFQGESVVVVENDLSGYYFWKNMPQAQIQRVGTAMACLSDGYVAYGTNYRPRWTDEAGVINGASVSPSADSVGWLGEPVEETSADDGIWSREFEKGMVILNTNQTYVTWTSGPGWRRLKGWADPLHNNWQRITEGKTIVGAWDALFLWRDGAPLPQPDEVDPDVEALVGKVAELESRMDHLEETLESVAVLLLGEG